MASLMKRAGYWHVQWYEHGHKRRKSTGIRTKTDPRGTMARQILRDMETDQAKGRAGIIEERPLTVADAFAAWLTTIRQSAPYWQHQTRVRSDKWIEWMTRRGIRYLDQVTPSTIDDWIAERRATVSAKTVQIEIGQLRAVAVHANRTRRTPVPVESWPKVRRVTAARPERIGAYSREEVELIITDLGAKSCRRHWQAPITLLAYLGCRWGELAALRVSDLRLDEEPPFVRIESRKTARTLATQHRYVEVHPRIMPLLRDLSAGKAPGDLLVKMPDQHHVTHVMGRCCARLGIQYRTPHSLRHSWISAMLRAGCPLAVVMQQAGHRSVSVTMRYTHLPEAASGWVEKALPKTSPKPAKINP